MSLDLLHRKLTDVARKRIHSGELTERGLARLCGISQPHMHNVLKGIRTLSTSSADRLLSVLNLSIVELIGQESANSGPGIHGIPLLRNRIGPGARASLSQFDGYAPFSISLTNALVDPVAGRIAPDLGLPKCIAPNDLALLDQNPSFRENPSGDTCWVVSEGKDLRIRCLRLDGERLLFANESGAGDQWRPIPLHDSDILDVVKARVVWIRREIRLSGSSC